MHGTPHSCGHEIRVIRRNAALRHTTLNGKSEQLLIGLVHWARLVWDAEARIKNKMESVRVLKCKLNVCFADGDQLMERVGSCPFESFHLLLIERFHTPLRKSKQELTAIREIMIRRSVADACMLGDLTQTDMGSLLFLKKVECSG